MGRQSKIKRERRQSGRSSGRRDAGPHLVGTQARYAPEALDALVHRVERGAARLAIEGPHAPTIRTVFVETVRQMESDRRLDGACHMLAALTHVLLSESDVEARLLIGEVLNPPEDEVRPSSFSHSWNDAGGVLIDVAIARPQHPMPYGAAPTLGGYFMPAFEESHYLYGVPVPLDPAAKFVLTRTLGEYAEGARDRGGPDLWDWYEVACRRLGIKTTAAQLVQRYRDVGWCHVTTQEGRDVAERLGLREAVLID